MCVGNKFRKSLTVITTWNYKLVSTDSHAIPKIKITKQV